MRFFNIEKKDFYKTNKKILLIITLILFSFLYSVTFSEACPRKHAKKHSQAKIHKSINSISSLEHLLAGNKLFIKGKNSVRNYKKDRKPLIKGQKPSAIIVCCSDSRVPPELIFNAGLGEIFVVRTAGNLVDTIELGSIEYAVEHLNVPLLIILGHQKCGAVTAATQPDEKFPPNIKSLINKIEPAVKKIDNKKYSSNAYIEQCIVQNIEEVINNCIQNSEVIKHAMKEKKLTVVGAKVSLENGKVDVVFNKAYTDKLLKDEPVVEKKETD